MDIIEALPSHDFGLGILHLIQGNMFIPPTPTLEGGLDSIRGVGMQGEGGRGRLQAVAREGREGPCVGRLCR